MDRLVEAAVAAQRQLTGLLLAGAHIGWPAGASSSTACTAGSTSRLITVASSQCELAQRLIASTWVPTTACCSGLDGSGN
jgi:hypothetical protein